MKFFKIKPEVLDAIWTERKRQDLKWGEDRHLDDLFWLAILVEELGETAKDILEGKPAHGTQELVQVAAVAVAWLEDLHSKGYL